jgi:hypothetical protein
VAAHRPASGREQHTQKITVYLSEDELFDLEHARLTLRRYGITTDRGRLVREAIAVVLADLDARGDSSVLARRVADPRHADGAGHGTGPMAGPNGADPGPGADRVPDPHADGLRSRAPGSRTWPCGPETQQ